MLKNILNAAVYQQWVFPYFTRTTIKTDILTASSAHSRPQTFKVQSSEGTSKPRREGTSWNLTMTLARREIFLPSLMEWHLKVRHHENWGSWFGGQEGWNCTKVDPDGYLFLSFSLVPHSSLHHSFFFFPFLWVNYRPGDYSSSEWAQIKHKRTELWSTKQRTASQFKATLDAS